MITRCAKMIFSAYRRDEFADPEGFVMQLGVVLERYEDDVIETVCSPRTGVQRRCKFPPSIAEIVDACEAEATAIETRKRYAAIPKPDRKLLPAPRDNSPGAWANVLINPKDPRYERLVSRTWNADPRDWKVDERGLHVALNWLDHPEAMRPIFKPYSDEQLRAMYPTQPAPAAVDDVAAAIDSEQSHKKYSVDECEEIPF